MIIVCPLSRLESLATGNAPGRVISLLGSQTEMPELDGYGPDRHLRLSFNDIPIAREGFVAPAASHIEQLVGFIDEWDRLQPMLIHCWAGVSRSTAAAYIALCHLQPDENEMVLAKRLRAASPSATPNSLMIELADDHLGRDGRMNKAITSIGRGKDAWEGNVFRLSVSYAHTPSKDP